MATFTDRNGVERTIQLDPLSVQRINAKFNIDLLEMFHGDLAARLAQNLPATMNIIGDLAFPGLDERAAADALADDTVIENATKAFMKAIVGFLPDSTILAICEDEQLVSELIDITA